MVMEKILYKTVSHILNPTAKLMIRERASAEVSGAARGQKRVWISAETNAKANAKARDKASPKVSAKARAIVRANVSENVSATF